MQKSAKVEITIRYDPNDQRIRIKIPNSTLMSISRNPKSGRSLLNLYDKLASVLRTRGAVAPPQ